MVPLWDWMSRIVENSCCRGFLSQGKPVVNYSKVLASTLRVPLTELL